MSCDYNSLKTIRGAIHIHTSYDDGDGSVEDIVTDASESGLDFIIITDHHLPYAAYDNLCGWDTKRKVLAITGVEFKSKEKNEFLGIGPHVQVATREKSTHEALALLKNLGSKNFIAHPQGRRHLLFGTPLNRWDDWDTPDYCGVEIWAYMHDWIENLRYKNLPDMCRNPDNYITGPDRGVLRKWDKQACNRKIAGIGSLDSHARRLPFGLDNIFKWAKGGILPYKQNFSAFSQYLLVDKNWGNDSASDTAVAITSLSEGMGWICHESLACGKNLNYRMEQQETSYPTGTEITFKKGTQKLKLDIDRQCRIIILNRGEIQAETQGTSLEFMPEAPGEYRAELYLDNKPWIFTNHIYLRTSDE